MRSLPRLRRTAFSSFASSAALALLLCTGPARSQTNSCARESEPHAGLSASEWSSLRAAHESKRCAAFPSAGGYEARNPGQRWSTHFDGRGASTRPAAGDWTWGLQLESYGFAHAGLALGEPCEMSACGERVAYDWDAALQEWWVNDARGLEHGFTLRERPTAIEAGPLCFTLGLLGDLSARVQSDGRGVCFSNADGVHVLTYAGLAVLDADGRSLPARFDLEGARELRLSIDERGARYPLTIDPIAQQAYLKASNTGANDGFGFSVSVSGDTVAVGADQEDSNALSVNGNQADNSAADSGAVYVFQRSGSTWTQQAYLKASNTGAGDLFGWSVSIAGDTLVVGALGEDSNAVGVNGNQANNTAFESGAAYVFVRSGSTWSQQAYLKASNTGGNDHFGYSVAAWEATGGGSETVVVGADVEASNATGVNGNQADNSASGAGAAYVFVRSGSTWSQQAYLKASNTGANDLFGISLSVSIDSVVVGADGESSNATGVNGNQLDNSLLSAGAAYVFTRSGTSWSQQAYLKASNTGAGDVFGCSVSLTKDTLLVGASGEDSNATGVNGNQLDNSLANAGAAYVFERSGTTWTQHAYLKASSPGAQDEFGISVSVSGPEGSIVIQPPLAVVGAWSEDSKASGVNGNALDNSALASGAAYVFATNLVTWSPLAYLKASNTGSSDLFGKSVSVSANTNAAPLIVVGAFAESSNAVGVNGNQTDNSFASAGAVYVFDMDALASPFCFGDGSVTACPCVNPSSSPGRGCNNSSATGGAALAASGNSALSADTLSFVASGEKPTATSIVTQGTLQLATAVVFGQGLRCVGGSLKRMYLKTAVAGSIVAPAGADLSVSARSAVLGDVISAGSTRYYYVYYRDATVLGGCPVASTFNTTQSLLVLWHP